MIRVSGEAIDKSTRSIRRGSGHGTSERWAAGLLSRPQATFVTRLQPMRLPA
jgi:hypothetical protein